MQINEYPIALTNLQNVDLFDVDRWDGVAYYESAKMTWADLKATIQSSLTTTNIGISDLLITDNIRKLKLAGGTSGQSFGVWSTDGTSGKLIVYGTGDTYIQNRIVVGYDPNLLGTTWGNAFAAPASSISKAFTVGTTNLSSDLMNVFIDGRWEFGSLAGPIHSMGRNNDNHYIFNTNGKGLLIGANNDSTVTGALLELRSTTLGLVFSRMTTVQRDAIVSPTISTTIYNTTVSKLQCWDGTIWNDLF